MARTPKKKPAARPARSKKPARPTAGRRRAASARNRLTPGAERRGLESGQIALGLDAPAVAALVAQVRDAGGAPIGAYREPLSGRPLLLACLPLASVAPTPFQRDLSPTHTRRLAQKIEESGSFLDPLIVVRGADGRLWTPNGRHRLAAAKVLGLRQITALLSPDEDLAFRILALNTEKAHNLKDRSLEVIRMARELAARDARTAEIDHAAEFEAPELLTLGLVYEAEPRFAGGAYRPFLKKVDRFGDRSLRASLRAREGYASRILTIDAQVKAIVKTLQERGFKSPYLRTLVVARINPVRFHKARSGDAGPAMEMSAALTRMAAAARTFDPASVKFGDLALVAAVGGGEEE
jgi:ParB family chromosome partitioning protein